MNKFLFAAAACLFGVSALAQTPAGSAAPATQNALSNGTQLQAELTKSVDAKKAKAGDEVTAKVTQDVKVNGSVVLQKGSKLEGHITEAQAKTKEGESKLGVLFNVAVSKSGQEVPFNGVIIAFSAPAEAPPTSSLGGGGMDRGSNNVTSGGRGITATPYGNTSNPSAGARDGGTPPMASSNAGPSANGNVTPGLNGMEGVAMNATPSGSLFHSGSRNVKLDNGAQMVVQVVAPAAAK